MMKSRHESSPILLSSLLPKIFYSRANQQIEGQSSENRIASHLTNVSREVVSAPSVIAGTFLLALRASSPGERAIYALLALILVVSSKTIQFYKTPGMMHVIFVVDMFDVCFEIPLRQAESSEVRRSQHFFHGSY